MRPPVALSIAGSDPSGGAGLQADLRTFTCFGVYGAGVPTSVTVQDTRGVRRVEPLDPALVREQIAVVLEDLSPGAVKIGLLPDAAIVEAVAASLSARPEIAVVLDPVLVATSGDVLAPETALAALVRELLPRAAVVTPNLAEAARLAGCPVVGASSLVDAARAIQARGAAAVLVKGGHLEGEAIDILLTRDGEILELRATRIPGPAVHGTGCALSSAIAARLACGDALTVAAATAKRWLHGRIAAAAPLGRGAAVLLPDVSPEAGPARGASRCVADPVEGGVALREEPRE